MPRQRLDDSETRMTLGEHLEELRRRLIYALLGLAGGTVVGLALAGRLTKMLEQPYVRVMNDLHLPPQLLVLDAAGGFTMYLKIALYAGLIISSPWIIYQLWLFVAAGLHPHERKGVLWAATASAGLFLAGALFFAVFVSEAVLKFLLGFSVRMGLQPALTFNNHVAFMAGMMIVFGLAFQEPLAVGLLAKMRLVRTRTLGRYRKHVIVALAILAAVLTPPDIFSQIVLLAPMWLLYELGVLLAKWFERRDLARRNWRAGE